MKLNKKGEMFNLTKEYMLWLVRIIVFFIVFGVIVIIIYIPISYEFKIDGLRHSLLRQHLIYDKNCLAYENERTYPGIIDSRNFNQANLEKCFSSENHGTQITLRTNSMNTIKLNQKWNKFEFCFDKNSFYCTNQSYYVLVYDKNKIEPGILNIMMMNPK